MSHTAQDRLGHVAYAQAVVQLLEAETSPLNLLLYGRWGTGKTTLLNILHEQLLDQQEAKYELITFNPWKYESNPNLLFPLLRAIYEAIPLSVKEDKKIASLGKSILNLALDIGVRAASKFVTGGLLSYKLGELKKFQEDDTPGVFRGFEDKIEKCQKAFAELVTELLKATKKEAVVVLLDDLDRCLPENVIALIEGVKLYLSPIHDLPIVFIWAMDKEIVSEAITAKYQLESFNGRDYLEKVFDFQIPVPDLHEENFESLIEGMYDAYPNKEKFHLLFGESPLPLLVEELNVYAVRNPRSLARIWAIIRILTANADTIWKEAQDIMGDNPEGETKFRKDLLKAVIISYAFREWRFNTLHHRDRWYSAITRFSRNDELSPEEEQFAEFLVKKGDMQRTHGPGGYILRDDKLFYALHRMSSLLQQFAC